MERKAIVVGVDGSPSSVAAVRWAAAEARLRGAPLHVVHAWDGHLPLAVGTPISASDWTIMREAAEGLVDSVVAQALGEDPDVEVTTAVVEGRPGETLVEAAAGAELLVVGSRGLSAVRELLLGSVSHHVVQHAECPVVVVHGPPVEAREVDERAQAADVHA